MAQRRGLGSRSPWRAICGSPAPLASWGRVLFGVGFSGDFGGSFFLTRLVGTAKARELYFTGRPVDAQEALSLGLVNRVVPDEQLHDVTMELARSLAHGPAVALALMKRNMNCAESGGLAELLDMEAAHQVETGRTEDHRQAAKAF